MIRKGARKNAMMTPRGGDSTRFQRLYTRPDAGKVALDRGS